MKKLLVLVLAMSIASSAFAVMDPDTNSMGFYADTAGNIPEITNAAPGPISVYAIIANPDFAELAGIEFGYQLTNPAGAFATGIVWAAGDVIDLGSAGNHIVGFSAPLPTSEATLVATINFYFLGSDFGMILTGSNPSSIGDPLVPTFVNELSQLVPGGDSTEIGNPNIYVTTLPAVPSEFEVVATEAVTFDSVKSLYR